MTKPELRNKLENLHYIVENALRTINETNIPDYVIISYLEKETGIDVEKLKE